MILFETLIPIFLLILLGYVFKRINFPNKEFWKSLDRFNYFILFPSLLIYKLSTAKIDSLQSVDFIVVTAFTILFIAIFLIFYNKYFQIPAESFTSIFQGGIRFNTYVFLALIDALYGDTGLVVAALLITFMIPFLNLLCIAIFAYYINESKVTVFSFLRSIFTNPLILACIFGGGLNYFHITLPLIFENGLSILSQAALPLGLLSVGVGLHFANLYHMRKEIFISSFAKLLLLPLLIFFLGTIFGVESFYLSIIVIYGTIPTATSAYILAKELGGDIKLISSLISFQTIFSILTISFFLQFIS
jgi:malonate transporter and related proteins